MSGQIYFPGAAAAGSDVDSMGAFVYYSCMGKTITIEDDVYKTLVKLKHGPGDSFSKVLRRHVFVPGRTNGEILDWEESQPPPNVDPVILERILKERGRRSGGRQ